MLRRFTDMILQGRFQVLLVAFLLAFVPLIGSISIIIAAFITLRKSVFEGALVTCAATLPYVISYYTAPGANDSAFVLAATGIAMASNVVTWLLAVILRQYNSWNVTLELAALLGIMCVGVIHFINPDIQNWWGAELTAYFNKSSSFIGQMEAQSSNAIPKEAQIKIIAYMKQYATGLIIASLLANAVFQVIIARWWQAVIFNPGGLRQELHQIRLSHFAAAVFLILMVLSFFDNAVSLDMMPILYAVFGAAGLSLLHYAVGLKPTGWFWLSMLYVGVVWLIPLSIAIIASIGLFDTLLDFRKRLRKSIT